MTDSPLLLDPRLIEKAREADIAEIATRVGSSPKRIGAAKWVGPCPNCGGIDRFSVDTAKQVYNCRGAMGGNVIALVRHTRGLDFAGAVAFIIGEECVISPTGEAASEKSANLPASDDERRARDLKSAKRIASEIRPLLGTPGERYLQETRCIDTAAIRAILARVDAIGWHGAVYFNEPAHALHGQRLGCIIGIMTDAKTAKPTGAISRTYLAPDLTKIGKAKTLGSPVGIVRLDPDDEVLEGLFLAEGIETALAAMSIGLRPIWSTGSTSPMAKFPVLSGIEHLSVLCDNDPNGAGEGAAREVERRWRAAGRQVSILRSERRGDLNDMVREDFAKMSGSPEQMLSRLGIRALPPANPTPANGVAKPLRFALVPFDQIKIAAGASYLVKGLIPRAGFVVIWGPPKCGKSFLTFDLAMHVALGWEYRGRRVKQGCVVYCALEGAQGFVNRVEAFRLEKLSGNVSPPFHLMASALSLVADQAAFLADIRAQLGKEKPVVVVIDTLNRSLAGSESDDKDMAAYVRAADAIRAAFDCAVIIVHHCGHGGDRPRGHSLLMGALDIQIAVKRDAAENIVATLELSKDGEAGAEIVSRLAPVLVGMDEDHEPVTSCVIVAAETTPASAAKPKSAKLSKGAQIALRALQKAIDEVGETPPASNTVPKGVKAVTLDQWRDYAYRLGISGSSEARARQIAFQRAHEALIAAKQVGEWDPLAWIV